jgi:hypothetical protein
MLVPRQIASLGKIAAKESTRYAFNGIRLERTKNGPRALVTDGRRALIAAWPEAPASEYPPIPDFDFTTRVDTFGTILPTAALDQAAKSCAKSRCKPILENFVIDEPSANGTVKLAANRLDSIERAEVTSIEGQFPPIDDCVPTFHEVHGVKSSRMGDNAEGYDVVKMRVKKSPTGNPENRTAAVVMVNPELLRGLLDSMIKTGADKVLLSVPCSPGNRPIRLDATTEDGITLTGILMPVNRA